MDIQADNSKEGIAVKFNQIVNIKVGSFSEVSFFLASYIFQSLNIQLSPENCTQFLRSIRMLVESVNSNLLTKTNFVEILVDSMVETKKLNLRLNLIREFHKRLEINWNQTALNRKYLREKWTNDKKNETYYEQLKRQDNERRKMERELEEKESLKFIQMIQEKEERERLKSQRENEELLKRMMEEEKMENQKRRRELEDKKETCEICLQQIDYGDLQTLQCRHSFHRHCVAGHIKASLNEKKVQIGCPAGCGQLIPVDIIYECSDADTREKFDKFCLDHFVEKNNKNTSWCPTPGCTSVFTYDDVLDNYRCLVCHKHYCLSCRCNYHYGQTCAEYRVTNSYSEDDKKFEEFVKGSKFKQCPKCNFWVERIAGCSTMRCRCGHEFCYDCGGSDCPHGACKNLGKKKR